MEVNLFVPFFTVFLIIILQTEVSSQNLSSYHPLKSLEGVQKGDMIQGVKNLKAYLKRYGYLSDNYHVDVDDADYFDDVTESAIKTYQLNLNLKVTGKLDVETMSMMMKPRCGVPDINKCGTKMKSGKHAHLLHFGVNHSHSHYAFCEGSPKWKASKRHLTYAFPKDFRPDAIELITKQIQLWKNAARTTFTFTKIKDFKKADIKISCEIRYHGDMWPFEGVEVLAHAFPPEDGRLHFNGFNKWVFGRGDGYDIGTTALHEFGHILGLGHSSDENAIMWPTTERNSVKGLGADDIKGINELYK